ncbi:hypothetical protein DVK44_13130 [Streptomyces paludis]|uniref:DUF4232 domain-containing protein n=1 Tax=Streptomyces paludis TaxID=2282738 RepID=A0A345HP76_9ACTN|nr:hypothetical protein DVK44_13130 [Streptomyces paludis]
MRNPVGPLPSTIYWRRRAVAATLIALLALLVVWVVSIGGGGSKKTGDTTDGAHPTKTIGPGPSGSGPAISRQPGGRDDADGSGEDGATSGSGDGGASAGTDEGEDGGKNGSGGGSGDSGASSEPGGAGATDGGDGTAAGSSGGTGGGSAGSGAGGTGSTGSGRQVATGSGLPDCAPNSLTLRLAATKVAYAPGEKPAFRLTAMNTSDTACKADFGPKALVLTITNADDDEVWTSKDCPKTGAALFEVPAKGTITRTVTWDRRKSTTDCEATKAPGAVGTGTYLVEVEAAGASVKQGRASIRLEKD